MILVADQVEREVLVVLLDCVHPDRLYDGATCFRGAEGHAVNGGRAADYRW